MLLGTSGRLRQRVFLALTTYYKFNNSMCEYAYQNGVAERLNGVIKNNYIAHWECNNYKDLVKNVDRAVQLYNIEKPHKSLGYKTPIEFEKSIVTLQQQERPPTKESLEVNYTKQGALSPSFCEQEKPQLKMYYR